MIEYRVGWVEIMMVTFGYRRMMLTFGYRRMTVEVAGECAKDSKE